ncbi:hypothetical protein RNT97_00640 [Staphylococcus pseudintermedius]|nr:hypothetical protein [Staphylococcus pseudintermedius]MDK3599940.1 hypothetical protein [Staphylococcus pseudintermedius]MDK3877740.1 hypothetical protein [Staphylococcus pseudintermedius]MDK4132261.1 hypothetical protein [Staphylococcus pseudintermedius]MDT0970486.1 hypothetical protein [Staphylococcus pseudintermedius]MDT1039273.1 hypothetical protein [Staphylococcus pseudintermedius]
MKIAGASGTRRWCIQLNINEIGNSIQPIGKMSSKKKSKNGTGKKKMMIRNNLISPIPT